jgi:hypothetical protein
LLYEKATPLGVRSLKAVAQHIQRHHHEFNYRGLWSREEDEQLKRESVKTHASNMSRTF